MFTAHLEGVIAVKLLIWNFQTIRAKKMKMLHYVVFLSKESIQIYKTNIFLAMHSQGKF